MFFVGTYFRLPFLRSPIINLHTSSSRVSSISALFAATNLIDFLSKSLSTKVRSLNIFFPHTFSIGGESRARKRRQQIAWNFFMFHREHSRFNFVTSFFSPFVQLFFSISLTHSRCCSVCLFFSLINSIWPWNISTKLPEKINIFTQAFQIAKKRNEMSKWKANDFCRCCCFLNSENPEAFR